MESMKLSKDRISIINENMNNNNLESMAQNLAKNKIIPSFLVQKKTSDKDNNGIGNATSPSNNTHLKINNFAPNKNSMLKTNITGTNLGQNKGMNLFNIPRK